MIAVPRNLLFAAAAVGIVAVAAVGYRAVSRPAPGAPLAPASGVEVAARTDTSATPGAPGSIAAAPPAAPAEGLPSKTWKPEFDVVRVTPAGEAVVAGRAEPRALVRLMMGDQTISDAVADANGQYVLMPTNMLPPGEHVLALQASGAAGRITSDQTVTVVVPARAGEKVIAALTAPDKPTVVLAQPQQPGGPVPTLAIQTAEAGEEGSFFASGVAPAGQAVRVYLNDALVATAKAGADGRWSLRVEHGMAAGRYSVRADVVDAAGKVAVRAEVPFEYPAASVPKTVPPVPAVASAPVRPATPEPKVAAAEPVSPLPAAGAVAQAHASGSVAVVPDLRSVLVTRGDTLWRISRRVLGRGMRYTQIYEANVAQIRDPNRIFPGQVFVAPTATN